MIGRLAQMFSSLSPTPSQREALAHASMSERSRRLMAESFRQDIMEHRLAHPTAPILPPRYVSVRCTLKLTSLRMRPDMERPFQDARFMQQIRPAIRALVYSSMQEFHPWFLIDSIEIKADLDY
jgi:hypothetical protein